MFGRIRDDAFGLIRRKRRRIGEQLAAHVHCDAGAVSAGRNIKNLLKSPDVSVIRGTKEQACGYGSFFKPFFLTIQFLFRAASGRQGAKLSAACASGFGFSLPASLWQRGGNAADVTPKYQTFRKMSAAVMNELTDRRSFSRGVEPLNRCIVPAQNLLVAVGF